MHKDFLPSLPAHVLAGVSGGADSVALLRMLLDSGVRVTAVYVNHGLRGEASDGDERFVRELCQSWQVPLLTYRADPPEHPGEDWARRIRYGFFREAAAQTGVHAIALAHHRDDQAETLLLHLLRGAGLNGLCGMAADTEADGLRILRPLLGFSRQELRERLKAIGQPWREDDSNTDMRYLRNALRGDILPRLERLIPGASARLANTAELLREDALVLDGMAEAFLAQHGGGRELPMAALLAQPAAMRSRIVRSWWQQTAGSSRSERSLSAAQTEALTALIGAPASARCNLPGGWHGQAGWTHLHLLSPEGAEAVEAAPLLESRLVRVVPCEGETGDGRQSQVFPREMLANLTVRSRRAGDWIRPFGSSGCQSLQDYLVNRRVDAPFRDRVPLICRGSEVLLAGGVGAGDVPRMNDNEINDGALVRWTMEFPWCMQGKQGG